jgi:hypothetical protein
MPHVVNPLSVSVQRKSCGLFWIWGM